MFSKLILCLSFKINHLCESHHQSPGIYLCTQQHYFKTKSVKLRSQILLMLRLKILIQNLKKLSLFKIKYTIQMCPRCKGAGKRACNFCNGRKGVYINNFLMVNLLKNFSLFVILKESCSMCQGHGFKMDNGKRSNCFSCNSTGFKRFKA